MIPYPVRRGETLTLYLEAVSGDPTTVSAVVSKLKPAQSGATPPASVAAAAVLQVTAQTTSPGTGILPGWYVTLTASQSAALPVGTYYADAGYQVGGAQAVTDTIVIQVFDAVSIP
jgi:hypothetical protein